MRRLPIRATGLLLAAASAGLAQRSGSETLPIRLELGGYGHHLTKGYGAWRGAEASLWIRANPYFVPIFFFESQTRPEGRQQNYAFFSYLNWSKSFYTTQGFSAAPQAAAGRVFFPKRRYDLRAHWKIPPHRNLVLTAGFTRFDMGAPGHGQISSAGAIYYRGKWVLEGNGFVNRNQPGNLVSGSGSFAAQYGQEGHSWTGAVAGGGRELYRYLGQLPFDARFTGYSLRFFHRKWLSRHVGIVANVDYQNRREAFQRVGASASLFFEF